MLKFKHKQKESILLSNTNLLMIYNKQTKAFAQNLNYRRNMSILPPETDLEF